MVTSSIPNKELLMVPFQLSLGAIILCEQCQRLIRDLSATSLLFWFYKQGDGGSTCLAGLVLYLTFFFHRHTIGIHKLPGLSVTEIEDMHRRPTLSKEDNTDQHTPCTWADGHICRFKNRSRYMCRNIQWRTHKHTEERKRIKGLTDWVRL